MFLAPEIIRKCEKCSRLIEQFDLLSGNTLGGQYWTDGFKRFPMLPEQPWLVKCPYCESLLWIDEQELFDEENILLTEQRSEGTRPYSMVSIVDVRDKLQEKNLSKRKELYLRIQLWWKSNDHVRNGGNGKVQVFHMQENLRVLLKLLTDQDDNSVIMMAEIHRQLGEFGETKRLLNREFDVEFNLIVSLIRDLADKKIGMVRELVYD